MSNVEAQTRHTGEIDLNKLESPPPKDDLSQVWLKLAQWFWRLKKSKM
jgi:hypothetical protein